MCQQKELTLTPSLLCEQDGDTIAVLHSNRAAALVKLGSFDKALEDAEVAVKRRPDWSKAHFRRATALIGLARYTDAVTAFDAGLTLEPHNESLLQGKQLALAELARHTDAISPLDKALALLAAKPPPSPVPVLVLSGFLGAGKTTLLQRILTHAGGKRLAVLVNDMAEINIDAQLVATAATTQERVVALTNGCICCTLRDDLLTEVSRMAAAGVYDYIVIESTGISEPMPVAATFTTPGRDGNTLSVYAPLDSMLTVVDASTVLSHLQSPDSLDARGMAAHEGDKRAISSLMVQQIECADTLLLNKCDLVSAQDASDAEALLRAMNPHARVMRTVRCDAPPEQLLNARRFDVASAEQSSSADASVWAEERAAVAGGRPAEGHAPETEACGISSVTCCHIRPFHPLRLWDCLMVQHVTHRLLRSKGQFWLASRPGVAWGWSTAGTTTADFGPSGQWRADAVPRELWPTDDPDWDAQWGDRRQNLVLIGVRGEPQAALELLQGCLLTDAEMAAGEEAWEKEFEGAHASSWAAYESADSTAK